MNTENPSFATPIIVEYHFEEVQKIKISLYDIDNHSSTLADDDFLGSIEASLGQVYIHREMKVNCFYSLPSWLLIARGFFSKNLVKKVFHKESMQ